MNGLTEGEFMIVKRLDFISDVLRFWVQSHAPGGYDVEWIVRKQRELETETRAAEGTVKGKY